MLAFVAFNDRVDYILNPVESILKDNIYGQLDTEDIPPSAIEVPVKINDNGTMYNTIWYAGIL